MVHPSDLSTVAVHPVQDHPSQSPIVTERRGLDTQEFADETIPPRVSYHAKAATFLRARPSQKKKLRKVTLKTSKNLSVLACQAPKPHNSQCCNNLRLAR